VVSDIGSNIEL